MALRGRKLSSTEACARDVASQVHNNAGKPSEAPSTVDLSNLVSALPQLFAESQAWYSSEKVSVRRF